MGEFSYVGNVMKLDISGGLLEILKVRDMN